MGDLLGRLFLGLIQFLETSWGKWVLVIISPILGFFAFAMTVIVRLEDYFNDMIDASVNSMGTATTVNFGTALGIANHFVPLDSLFIDCILGINILIGALIYRTIKSWVPTLS